MKNILEKFNKLSLPTTILVACVILGSFYYVTEVSKQNSIERQQRLKLENEQRIENERAAKENYEALKKSLCVTEAEQQAIDFYKKNCTYNCKSGQYYIVTYDSAYKQCLQREGLD